jgi:hypothetical protein
MSASPSPRQAFDRVLANVRSTLHTAFPAQVLAYDVAAQTVDLRPAIEREVPTDDPRTPWDLLPLPDLYGVQLMWPRGGSYAWTFPLKPGDWVLVLCAEQSTMLWRSRGEAPSPPGILDAHGLNGCVALPGWFPDKDRLANVSTTDLVIGAEDGSATIRIKPDGTVVLSEDAVALALAPLVEKAIEAAIKGHTHTVSTTGTAAAQSGTTAVGVLGGTVLSTAASKVKGV